MKPNWLLVVSFKTELLSEYLIHKGYREDLSKLLPKVGLLRNRMIIDNDIYVDLNEVGAVQKVLQQDILTNAQEAYKAIEEQSKRLVSISEKVVEKIGPDTTDKELVKRLELFFKEFQATLGAIGIPTIIDLTLESTIKKNLEEAGIENVEEAFASLAISDRLVATNKERDDLLDIAEAKLAGEDISNFVFEHAKKYGWLYSTLFLGEPYTPYQIGEEVTLISDPVKERGQTREERKKYLDGANETLKKISIPERKLVAEFLQTAVYFRTARLEWMNHACFIARPLLEEVGRRLGVSLGELIYLLPNEIYDGLVNQYIDTGEIDRRQKGYAFISDDKNEYALFVGRELSRWKENFSKVNDSNIVKGTVACKGKATGAVVVVKDRSELNKVQQGDILVTPLTTPDFIVAMKKAAAIITDLGGMTSHAAIVSRELGTPCIVGTENATKVLKDGHMVEVDADNGVVRILEKVGSIVAEIEGLSWFKSWEGNFLPFLSTFGAPGYFEPLERIFGFSLDHFLVTGRQGVTAGYWVEEELRSFGTKLAALAAESPVALTDWADKLKQETDHFRTLLAEGAEHCLNPDNFEKLCNSCHELCAYQIAVREVVNYLPDVERERCMPQLESARKHSEKIFFEQNEFTMALYALVAERSGYPTALVQYTTQEEIGNYLKSGLLPDKQELEKRAVSSGYYMHPHFSLLSSEEVERIENSFIKNNITELHGQVAHKGNVTGRVHVIKNFSEIGEFRIGDILVTGMTDPNYISVMEKAGAIVTDAGGMLSHAAITAREMKKPCIVSTKIGTKVLKDGDLVEVDADKGIVRILEKAN